MKYVVVLGDGMADYEIEAIHGTPLSVAKKPTIDKLARLGQIGLVQTIPAGFKPGSDVANLSVMGYAPERYYSGRSPLEALSIGIAMEATDVAVRCNLVTLSDDADFSNTTMLDYSSGEISTEEAHALIASVQTALGNDVFKFYGGVSYRNCMIIKNGSTDVDLTPPHDISGRKIADYLPKGDNADELRRLIEESGKILKDHPVNKARIASGKNPATNIWLWGAGSKPKLDSFKSKFGLNGAVVSAVDLLKGIAVGASMRCPDVPGATGTLSTNFNGKVDAVIDCLKSGCDYVYLHVEAPDECGHQGDLQGKIASIEMLDGMLKRIWDYLDAAGEPYVITVMPDHATPIAVRTHTSNPIPYAIYKSFAPARCGLVYNEETAKQGVYLPDGQKIIKTMLEK